MLELSLQSLEEGVDRVFSVESKLNNKQIVRLYAYMLVRVESRFSPSDVIRVIKSISARAFSVNIQKLKRCALGMGNCECRSIL